MYILIDESNNALPANITEEAYLLLNVNVQVLYRLEDDDRDFRGSNSIDIGFYDEGFDKYRPGEDDCGGT